MTVVVPNLIGLGRTAAESELDRKLLRHIAQFPFGTGDGSATQQSPVGGTVVSEYTIVTVGYPTPLGPLPDSPVEGPTPPSGTYEGQITSVTVGGDGAWADFLTTIDGSQIGFTVTFYFDNSANPPPLLRRGEWMRRGATLGLAQRAFAGRNNVRLVIAGALFVQSITLLRS